MKTEQLFTTRSPYLKIGHPAPNFRLVWKPGQTIELSSWKGKPVVLVFYPHDWEPVSAEQLMSYQEVIAEVAHFEAMCAGISVDSAWSHQAFARQLGLHFPLLADFHPRGKVARTYGVYRSQDGTAERALFVLDALGVLRWRYVSPLHLNPGTDGILSALEQLKSI